MMTHKTTVYFDTSFYVYLQRADPELARSVVADLTALGVRRVESFELFLELDVSPNLEGKRNLVERLAPWSIDPLQLGGADLRWLALAERPPEIAVLREMNAKGAYAHAVAATAEQAKSLSVVDQEAVGSLAHEALGVQAIPDNFTDAFRTMKPVLDMMESLELPEGLIPIVREMRDLYEKVDQGRISQAEAAQVAATFPALVAVAAEAAIPGINKERDIQVGVLTGNERAVNVALKRASEKSERRHISTIADLGHLSVFLRNLGEIDLLMMDGPQLTALDQRAAAEVQDVRGRIFNAQDLPAVVSRLKALKPS